MSQAHPRADHDRHGFTTEQVHGGAATDGDFGARVSPIHLSAGFVFDDFAQARDRFAGDDPGYDGVTMQLFESVDAFWASLSEPDYADISADVDRFMDASATKWILTEEPTVVFDRRS